MRSSRFLRASAAVALTWNRERHQVPRSARVNAACTSSTSLDTMSVSLNTFICSPVAASRRYERPAPRPRAATFPRARVTFYRRNRLDTRRGRAASDPRDSPSDGQLAAALRPEASRASPRRAAPVPAPPASSARPAARRSARRRARARGARPSARRVAPCSPPPGWALCFCRAPRPRRLRPPTWTTWRRGRWRARRCSRRRARRLPRRRRRRRRRRRPRPRPRVTDSAYSVAAFTARSRSRTRSRSHVSVVRRRANVVVSRTRRKRSIPIVSDRTQSSTRGEEGARRDNQRR